MKHPYIDNILRVAFDAAWNSYDDSSSKLAKAMISGTLLLHDLMQVASIENEDGMPVIKFISKPNGGEIAYVRYDAMVKKLNNLLKSANG